MTSLEEARRRLQRAVHRDADQQQAKIADAPGDRAVVGTVTGIDVGVASDGLNVLRVTYRGGETVAAGWNRAQTFAVGDTVKCTLTADHQLFIDYIVGGAP